MRAFPSLISSGSVLRDPMKMTNFSVVFLNSQWTVISPCGRHGLHVLTLVDGLLYGHASDTVPTQHRRKAGKIVKDHDFSLNCAKSSSVQVRTQI